MKFTRKLHRQEIKCLSYENKIAYAKWWYQSVLRGEFDFNNAVIDCYFRSGFRIHEVADILNTDEESVDFAIDIIKQNAK